MSNTNNRTPNPDQSATNQRPPQQAPRGPKFIWIVRPSFSVGSCRAYFSENAAMEDYGQPKSKWYNAGSISQINVGPSWDPDNATWELEKIEVR